MKKFLAIMIVAVMAVALCVTASANIQDGIQPNQKDWKWITHTSYDEVRPGIVCGGKTENIDTPTVASGTTQVTFWGWIGATTDIEGFSYSVNGGEKVSDPAFVVAAENAVVQAAAPTKSNDGNETPCAAASRFQVIVPVTEGSQRVRVYADFADGSDLMWDAILTVGEATELPPEETEPEETEPEGTEPEGTDPEGTEPEGTEPEGTEPEVTARELDTIEDGKLNIVIDGGVEKKEAKAGEEVEVKVELKNVGEAKIASLVASLTWNEKLSLVKAVYDCNEGKAGSMANVPENDDGEEDWSLATNPFKFNWVGLKNANAVKADSTFITLTFKVAEDAEAGSFLAITAEIDPENIFDINDENIDFKLINGGIDVIGEESATDEVTEPATDAPDVTTEAPTTQGESNPNNPATSDIAVIAIASVAAVALAGAVIGKKALKK